MQLGKPVARAKANEPALLLREPSGTVQTSYTTAPRLSTPTTVIRAQSPSENTVRAAPGVPLSPEESFNCGVVTEGPPVGHPVLGAPGRWVGELFARPVETVGGWLNTTFQSDHAFDQFISPTSNPFFFEDPRSLTEIRPIILYQRTPRNNPLFQGGDIQFYGLQGRIAFNERWSLVFHKLGFIAIQPDSALPSAGGFAEIQLGPKYTFWRDDVTNTVAAFGLNFEIPSGPRKVFQDTGNGAVTPYVSVGQQLFTNFHFLGTFGYRVGFDSDRSDAFFLSLHLDYSIINRIFPFVEFNWYHYTSNGKSLNADFEGRDLFNLGATRISGGDNVTLGAGIRFKITPTIEAGILYEAPISNREDLMDYRLSLDVIFRY